MKNLTGTAILITGYRRPPLPPGNVEGRQRKHGDCLTVVEKSVTHKCQSKNSTPATSCLYKHNTGSLATVFQTEVYAILAYSDYCRSANMRNMTIYIFSDSKAALWALSSYIILSKLLHQYCLSLQDLSNNNRVRLFWVPGHCDIKGGW
jgi:hypothetical protein